MVGLDASSASGVAPRGRPGSGFCGDTPVHGFAVCRYDDGGSYYRFSCDREWETVNDSDHEDEEGAKRSIPMNYLASAHRVVWHKAGS